MPGQTDRRKGSQETSFQTPYKNTSGERKTKDGWDKHKHGLQAHTKKQALPPDKQTKNVPAKHQTRYPRDAPQSPTLQSKTNQPEPKKKTPAINDPTAGSPTVTLLRLLLPLNDKVQ